MAAVPNSPDHPDPERQPSGVACYLRVSTDHQTVANQQPALDRYVAAYGITPHGWYVDQAISGKWVAFGDRPEGKRLLADARAGHIGLVVCWRLDRFGRNALEILQAVKALDEAGARLVSLKESFDTREASGRLTMGILASVAEFEAESISQRAEAGMARKLSEGAWMGGMLPSAFAWRAARPLRAWWWMRRTSPWPMAA